MAFACVAVSDQPYFHRREVTGSVEAGILPTVGLSPQFRRADYSSQVASLESDRRIGTVRESLKLKFGGARLLICTVPGERMR